MKMIYKYTIVTGTLQVPRGSKLLDVQMQDGAICGWFIVDTETSYSDLISVKVCGTGFEAPEGHGHVGTVQQGPFVWHVFFDHQFLLDTI